MTKPPLTHEEVFTLLFDDMGYFLEMPTKQLAKHFIGNYPDKQERLNVMREFCHTCTAARTVLQAQDNAIAALCDRVLEATEEASQ